MTNLEKAKGEISDGDIGAVRHESKLDAGPLNRAVQRAVKDENFLSSSGYELLVLLVLLLPILGQLELCILFFYPHYDLTKYLYKF
jgi:hypothetical protein